MASPAHALCRQVRRRAGLSQRALADLAGVSPSTIARIERGRLEPTLDLLLRLVDAADLRLRLVLEPDDGTSRRQMERRAAMTVEARITEAASVAELRGMVRADA
jgi:transcriptional regulator with XRE-family HTH domain